MRHKKPLFIVLLLLPLLLLFWKTSSLWTKPLVASQAPPKIIIIEKATSAHQLARLFKEQHLVDSSQLLLLILRLEGWTHQIKAGVYQANSGDTVMDLLHKIVTGEVVVRKFTIIEGSTQNKVAQELEKAPYLQYNAKDWSAITGGNPNAEGLLLAETYQYRGGSAGKSVLEQAHQHLLAYLQEVWDHRTPGLPYKNPYELLIAASIVEKETAIPEERKLIAGVLVNRLKKGMPLQMDPTVIYAMGSSYKGKLIHNDLLIDSPYNSYQYRGLPPTPIAMVGKEALDAAAHPQMSQYLYFVAKGDGSHQFSETYQQQRQAIDHYQKKG